MTRRFEFSQIPPERENYPTISSFFGAFRNQVPRITLYAKSAKTRTVFIVKYRTRSNTKQSAITKQRAAYSRMSNLVIHSLEDFHFLSDELSLLGGSGSSRLGDQRHRI